MELVIRVIEQKKDKFNFNSIVSLMWTCARVDFSSSNYQIIDLFKSFASYDRLIDGLATLETK